MAQLTGVLAALLRGLARLLPPARRQWAEAVDAEARMLPAGWPRIQWLWGGVWLIAKEARVIGKLVYWLGIGAVAAAAAWAVWLSWRTVPSADAERITDRFRVLVGIVSFLVLPLLGRRSGVFGPVADGITARLVRVAGCAALCFIGAGFVRIDRHAGNHGVGSGRFSWPQEIAGLALICGLLTAPHIVRTRWPQVESGLLWVCMAITSVVALVVAPFQTLTVGYVVVILGATSRRSPVSGAALAAGAVAGAAASPLLYGVLFIPGLDQSLLPMLLLVMPAIVALAAVCAGVLAAWRLTGIEDPQELREARVRQGLLAGATAGAVAGLVLTLIVPICVLMIVIGPLVGSAVGAVGGALAADHPRKLRPDGLSDAGLFVSSA
jgi:hypothetical protein